MKLGCSNLRKLDFKKVDLHWVKCGRMLRYSLMDQGTDPRQKLTSWSALVISSALIDLLAQMRAQIPLIEGWQLLKIVVLWSSLHFLDLVLTLFGKFLLRQHVLYFVSLIFLDLTTGFKYSSSQSVEIMKNT